MKRFLLTTILILPLVFLSAAEYNEGNIRLVLREDTGRFSLFTRTENNRYEPLFFNQDPRTSFITVLLNDRAFKLGDTSVFRTRLGTNPGRPSLIFESAQMIVTQEFIFIRTPGSNIVNGVEMAITLQSKSEVDIVAGFRFLLDTHLGEPGSSPHFLIDNRPVNSETLINNTGYQYWVSKNNNVSLMGSIAFPDRQGPNSIHFANWKRLSDVSWKVPFENGRSFNAPPYSISDSAVCYYFEPMMFRQNESFTASIFLAQEDADGFYKPPVIATPVFEPAPQQIDPITPATPPVTIVHQDPQTETVQSPSPGLQRGSSDTISPGIRSPSPAENEDQMKRDLIILEDLLSRIDQYMETGGVSEDELAVMEQTLNRLKTRYGFDLDIFW